MSRVIFKMSFKHPNLKDTVSKNVSHVQYIATRSGVDKTITEADLKRELEKGIEDIAPEGSSDESYVRYIDERPRSHGLFGPDGIEDPGAIQDEISKVESFVWRGIVSLREEDAISLGYLKKDQWQDMLRKKIPDMANQMGIPITNLRWVGAVHMEKGHPHAHIMIWEKDPQKTIGIISGNKLTTIRKLLTDEIFEEERFQLMNEKNIMRDLIRDLAQDDISHISRIMKDVRSSGHELKTFIRDMNLEGVSPKLYNEQEQKLILMVKDLSDKMPGKGRVALKFMPEDIKEEVRAIADYLLSQPEFNASLEKNLKSTEELTKMYTGQEDAIQKARENAYNDIRDRICQIILKGAVEWQKDSFLYADLELSIKAVDFIQNMYYAIDLMPERTKVLALAISTMMRSDYTDDDILNVLKSYLQKEDIHYPEQSLGALINEIRGNGINLNELSSQKKIDFYLSVAKLNELSELDAFQQGKKLIGLDSLELEKRLLSLQDSGFIKKEIDFEDGSSEYYCLTNKGIEEILSVKNLDKAEKEILKMLEKNEKEGEGLPSFTFHELLDNQDVFGGLYDKDPDEFKIGKYDTIVRKEFGENNRITFNELEDNIYKKYTDENSEVNESKAEDELENLKKRIEKLVLNGFVEYDKATGIYSFTDEMEQYFEYDQEKGAYLFTDQAIEELHIPVQMEFTRYDVNVTLGYIDKAPEGLLTLDSLKETIQKEIVNQEAEKVYERLKYLLESKDESLEKIVQHFIAEDSTGNLSCTEEGQFLGKSLNRFDKFIKSETGSELVESLKGLSDEEAVSLMGNFKEQYEKGYIIRDESGSLIINPVYRDIKDLLYQVYKEGGSLNKAALKGILHKNMFNLEAQRTFKYLTRRLDNLKKGNYLTGAKGEYKLTAAGIEKRQDLLIPQRNLLRKSLTYLKQLGLITQTGMNYQVTERYYKYMKDVAISKKDKTVRTSNFPNDIVKLIDRTQNKLDVGKIERNNNRMLTGRYLNNAYAEVETNYQSVRSFCNVQDIVDKPIKNLATILLVSGVGFEQVKEMLHSWNIRSNSNINTELINDISDESYEKYLENKQWGKSTVISTKEWKETFLALGVQEKDIPKWMYKGENWETFNQHGIGAATMANDLWKSVWSELEKQRMQQEAQAEFMKDQMSKQLGVRNKEAEIEKIRKSKDRSVLFREDELER